ncbi:FecR family protein [Acinetobacter larvae]|uniref:Iron dicitrate transport regulator FecR n=1 Tax=Acinetobacter larvae TaxID=1789224 RepID=A0A1B2LZP4_9GAMM|nr:FecR family protein [Acinetobacter larvae]AOA58414.1 hypothetical protein BFG52_08635 [Acinetobacter larvae]
MTPFKHQASKQEAAPQHAEILEQAVDWLLCQQQGQLSAAEQQQFEAWLAQSATHRKVWNHAQRLQDKLQLIPNDAVLPVLATDQPQVDWKKYLWLLAFLPLGGLSYYGQQQHWLADYRNGQQTPKRIYLSDGSEILLHNDSAIDVNYNQNKREIHLLKGEIWIKTQHDPAQRPFSVRTAQGQAIALGTEYLVAQHKHATDVAVELGAVLLQPQHHPTQAVRLEVNQQAQFNTEQVSAQKPLDLQQVAWRRGFLMVNEMPLAQFIQRIQDYHTGHIQLDHRLEQIKISGSYPIDDRDKILEMLAQDYALQIDQYAAGYWLSISPKTQPKQK